MVAENSFFQRGMAENIFPYPSHFHMVMFVNGSNVLRYAARLMHGMMQRKH